MQSLSYREVITTNSCQEEWHEITLNTGIPIKQKTFNKKLYCLAIFSGGTHSTLQDIKVAEKAGGFCYKNTSLNNRNRFIYWRTYQDVLELSEISLDFNLYQNNVRYKFTDSPVIAVNIIEQSKNVVLLVCTVCSLHRLCFRHPDSPCSGSATATGISMDLNDSQSFSIFKDANAADARAPSSFYVIDNLNATSNY